MPNRRRRKLSTAMSAVAALAVASPFAVAAVSEMAAPMTPAPQQHDFVQAAMVTDLPGDVMNALQSSLSQFGIVVPNVPSGILGSSSIGSNPPFPQGAPTPGLTAPTPGLTAPTPGLTAPAAPGALTNPALTNPAPGLPQGTPTTPTTPITPGLTTPPTGLNPALANPLTAAPGLGAPGMPGTDPLAGTYPILGDPSVGMPSAPSGGLMSDLSNAASQLGASQAIDLLKGVVVPSIMQAIKSAGTAAPAAAPPIP